MDLSARFTITIGLELRRDITVALQGVQKTLTVTGAQSSRDDIDCDGGSPVTHHLNPAGAMMAAPITVTRVHV